MDNTVNLKEMNLSDQALGALMMALQKSLMEQSDIVPVLKELKFVEDETGGLIVLNPTLIKLSHDDAQALESVKS